MDLVTWNEGLSVSVAEIDQQHKKLIGMVNNLNNAMRRSEDNVILGGIVDDLLRYTGDHFHQEATYFNLYEYPDAISHKKEHKDFVEQVLDFKIKMKLGEAVVSEEVMDFLAGWLKDHIMGSDKKYSQFFNEKGLM